MSASDPLRWRGCRGSAARVRGTRLILRRQLESERASRDAMRLEARRDAVTAAIGAVQLEADRARSAAGQYLVAAHPIVEHRPHPAAAQFHQNGKLAAAAG